MTEMIDCPDCYGEGSDLFGNSCWTCEGSGEVEEGEDDFDNLLDFDEDDDEDDE